MWGWVGVGMGRAGGLTATQKTARRMEQNTGTDSNCAYLGMVGVSLPHPRPPASACPVEQLHHLLLLLLLLVPRPAAAAAAAPPPSAAAATSGTNQAGLTLDPGPALAEKPAAHNVVCVDREGAYNQHNTPVEKGSQSTYAVSKCSRVPRPLRIGGRGCQCVHGLSSARIVRPEVPTPRHQEPHTFSCRFVHHKSKPQPQP
jgi:hypothetical protein